MHMRKTAAKHKLKAEVIVTKVGKPSRDIYALYATYSI
jgi:hypothetical protein